MIFWFSLNAQKMQSALAVVGRKPKRTVLPEVKEGRGVPESRARSRSLVRDRAWVRVQAWRHFIPFAECYFIRMRLHLFCISL